MRLKTIIDEDFVNYRKPAMFIGCISCGGKCAIDGNFPLSVCQNDEWRNAVVIDKDDDELIQRYLQNDITHAIVFGLLEPFEQSSELYNFIKKLRLKYECHDDVVIYTGYTEDEIADEVQLFAEDFGNIVVKYGRFRLGDRPHYDDVLGVKLASDNQYAVRFS